MNLQISPLLSSSSGNTSLLSTESTTLLVDAGAAGSLIEKAIREVGFSPHRLAAFSSRTNTWTISRAPAS